MKTLEIILVHLFGLFFVGLWLFSGEPADKYMGYIGIAILLVYWGDKIIKWLK